MHELLLVEDDDALGRGIRLALEGGGLRVTVCRTLAEGRRTLEDGAFDLLILDVNLPDGNGLDFLRTLRRDHAAPVILLTANDLETDIVTGLELGADDYITKPFDSKELVARVKAVLRRTQGPEEEKTDVLSFPGLTVSLSQYECHYEGHQVEMPPKELEVLYFLASHVNQVFTREQLLEQVWGFDFFGDSRTVDVHIKRLREKLPGCEKYGWMIRTVWGVGYKFEMR